MFGLEVGVNGILCLVTQKDKAHSWLLETLLGGMRYLVRTLSPLLMPFLACGGGGVGFDTGFFFFFFLFNSGAVLELTL